MRSEPHDTDARALAAIAARAPTTEVFLSATGRLLSTSPLQVDRIFLSLKTLHPAFRARTYPMAVAVAANGTVFVADFGNNRIQKWQPGANE